MGKPPQRDIRNALAVGIGAALMGCSTTVNLYPVEGPLSERRPLPVLSATAEGIAGNTGPITLTLPDGEECKGQWSSAAGQQYSFGTVNLFSEYGSIFGTTYSASNVGGINPGQAFLVCSGGTTIDAQFYTGSGTANGFGIAKDSNGNVFRMLF